MRKCWHVSHARNVVSAKAGLKDSRVLAIFPPADQGYCEIRFISLHVTGAFTATSLWRRSSVCEEKQPAKAGVFLSEALFPSG